MAETINVGYYFMAFIDIVGQRDKLKGWTSLPKNEAQRKQLAADLTETSEYVKELRQQFDEMYAVAHEPTGLLDHLDADKRAWVEQRKKTFVWRRGFSDSYIMTVPCWKESAPGVHAGGIFEAMFGICGIFNWALARQKPFRGGIDIGLGTEIDEEEVYGPVAVQAYELESRKAKWPRVLVGEGLSKHLDDLEQRCGNDLAGIHTKINIANCRRLITNYRGGKCMLDVMGEAAHSVLPQDFTQAVQGGYQFVVSEERRFQKSGPKKLHRRYSQLQKYIESRLPFWDLELITD